MTFRAPFCGSAALLIAGLCSGLLPSAGARAFSAPALFAKAATGGGTEGRFFTGSPADGYGCDVCHSGGPSLPLYVTGLPVRGYVPGTTYELRLSWPEFALREQQLLALNPDPATAPTMSLMTELIAETGKGSGKLVIKSPEMYTTGERCHYPLDRAGQTMWIVKAKTKPLGEILLECDSAEFNDRCLVSQIGCGASEIRMRWTAPPEWQGTIWLNAGLVTTDHLDTTPNNDGVFELSVPLPPAASTSAGYVEKLDGDCSAIAVGASAASTYGGPAFGLGAAVIAYRARRRARAKQERR